MKVPNRNGGVREPALALAAESPGKKGRGGLSAPLSKPVPASGGSGSGGAGGGLCGAGDSARGRDGGGAAGREEGAAGASASCGSAKGLRASSSCGGPRRCSRPSSALAVVPLSSFPQLSCTPSLPQRVSLPPFLSLDLRSLSACPCPSGAYKVQFPGAPGSRLLPPESSKSPGSVGSGLDG